MVLKAGLATIRSWLQSRKLHFSRPCMLLRAGQIAVGIIPTTSIRKESPGQATLVVTLCMRCVHCIACADGKAAAMMSGVAPARLARLPLQMLQHHQGYDWPADLLVMCFTEQYLKPNLRGRTGKCLNHAYLENNLCLFVRSKTAVNPGGNHQMCQVDVIVMA